ncbi:MAG: extensin family protein [Paracoccaceae bacterium]
MTRCGKAGAGASLLVFGLLAGSALAEAPLQSLRPVLRPILGQVLGEGGLAAQTGSLSDQIGKELEKIANQGPLKRPKKRADRLKDRLNSALDGKRPKGAKGGLCGDREIIGEELAPIAAKVDGCGLKEGVRVRSIAGVKLSTPATMDCETAKALKKWVKGPVRKAVGSHGGGVARLQVAASYVCRTRNSQSGARISEHGRGRAIDISALVLANGKVISVLKDWGHGKGGKILKSIRKGACGPFNTVLGPGSDRHHKDHLHLDTARGRGPYCH